MALARRPACACLRLRSSTRSFSDDALVKTDTYIPVNASARQAVSGITATCFGATGFVGNYVVQRLARVGSDCIVPYRGDGLDTRHLKIMGDLGKVVPLPVDFTKPETLRNTVARSNVVINMIGGIGETRNYSYHDTNVKVVHRLCKAVAESHSVKRFIHVSALGADLKSPSALLRAKAEGELVVKDFFPHATILRPANIFGEEDSFLNLLAQFINASWLVPMLGDGGQRLQPIYAADVATAIVAACVDSGAPGRTFELGGPDVFTKKELLQWISENIYLPADETMLMPMNKTLCKLFAQFMQLIPNRYLRLMTPDQVDQAAVDLVVSKGALTIADLGVKPFRLQDIGPSVLLNHGMNRNPKNWNLTKGDPRVDRLRVGA